MKKEKIALTQEEELQMVIDKAKKKHGKVYKTYLADETILLYPLFLCIHFFLIFSII